MKKTLQQAVENERPLLMPLAHDALTARLIERAGFRCVGIGGSAMLASRYGLPDIGVAALGEMAAGIRDVVAATSLPVVVDGDDGYGDCKSVVHMVESYARLGVAGIVLEDQIRGEKQPGDAGALGVVPVEEMKRKIRRAVETAQGTEIRIIARCDAMKPEGLDAALARADAYAAAGAHGVFVPGAATPEDLATIGARFKGLHLMTVMFEGRPTFLPPAQLFEMGYRHIALPGLLLPRVVDCIDRTLQGLAAYAHDGTALPAYSADKAQAALNEALRFDKWRAI